MTPLDTYRKNRKNYGMSMTMRGDDEVFAYPRMRMNLRPRTPHYRRWWNVRMCYYRTYREVSYDFVRSKTNSVR